MIDISASYKIIDDIDLNLNSNTVELGEGLIRFKSRDIVRLLKGQQKVALLALSIGEEIEKKSERLFKEGQLSDATILDAIGSIAAEEVANSLTEIIRERAKRLDLNHLTFRYSPGYGDLELDIQPKLLKLLGSDRLKIRTNSSNLLIPQKSITALIGLGNKENSSSTKCDFNCKECSYDICIYRKGN